MKFVMCVRGFSTLNLSLLNHKENGAKTKKKGRRGGGEQWDKPYRLSKHIIQT